MGQSSHVDYVKQMILPLCDYPDLVSVVANDPDDRGILINVYVAKTDAGRVIGLGGKTINAIRALLSVYSQRLNIHIGIRINAKND